MVVEERALAALGDEQLLVGRIVGQRRDDHAAAFKRDRDGEMRNAVQKIGRPIQRIDDPPMGLVGAGAGAAFLAEETVIRPRLGQFLAHDLLRAPVGGGDEIAGAFDGDLQLLDFAEVALEASPGTARGLDHDVEYSGMQHGVAVRGNVRWR